ncbi:sugar phosphate isomerase/epimerase [Desulfopila sp. IMCC35008]|uniref:sugar phosphate isomerase/epimerase family protein n=1 Tax=Desulfopila sp. IMCC35008 TaxID=2653858 RepID=UPI0013D76A3D|nr:sugar phosphate isomerase/epimerase [Desulfopila sp. IMCC35008]
MQYGAMNFPVSPLLAEIETFAQMGFDYLELTMDPPMAHYSTLSRDLSVIKRSLQDNELGLLCHLPTFVLTADLTETIRHSSVDEMLHSLRVAANLGARKVVLHPSMVFGMGPFVKYTVKDYFFEFLAKMVTAAQHLEIEICLENMMPRNILGVEPADFEEIFARHPTLKMTLDTGHANIDASAGYRLLEMVERFGDRIGHLHISDNLGKKDQHLAVGQGTVDFSTLISRLVELGYDATITLEIFDQDRRLLTESRDKIQRLVETAKQLRKTG